MFSFFLKLKFAVVGEDAEWRLSYGLIVALNSPSWYTSLLKIDSWTNKEKDLILRNLKTPALFVFLSFFFSVVVFLPIAFTKKTKVPFHAVTLSVN